MVARLILILMVSLLAIACDEQARQAQGFSLPEGDAELGKVAFAELGCTSCHLVEGVGQGDERELSIPLGGENARTKTYGGAGFICDQPHPPNLGIVAESRCPGSRPGTDAVLQRIHDGEGTRRCRGFSANAIRPGALF